jgi:hypothetical protein
MVGSGRDYFNLRGFRFERTGIEFKPHDGTAKGLAAIGMEC